MNRRARAKFFLVLVLCAGLGTLAFVLGRSLLLQQVQVVGSAMPDMEENIEQRIQGFQRVNVRDGAKVWDLSARQARIQKGQSRILVDEPSLELHDEDWTMVRVRSGRGQVDLVDGDLSRVQLDGGLIVEFDGYRLESDQGTYLGEGRQIVLARGGSVKSAVVDLSGDFILLDLEKSVVGVVGNVVTEFHADRPSGDAADDEAALVDQELLGADLLTKVSFADPASPVVIRAGELQFDLDASRILYRLGVEVEQGEFRTRSEELEIVYAGDPREESAVDLKKVAARGDVVVRQKERTAWGDSARFLQETRTIELAGNARLREGDSEVRGEKLTVLLDEGASVIEAKPGRRVSAVLFAEDFGGPPGSDKEPEKSVLPEDQP
jgi:lipopolysaccharide transport protein LptA